MFFEPQPTPWDLRWRMLGTDIRVHPMFWLITAILGWSAADPAQGGSLKLLVLWIACVFVSILLHEFGHIGAGRLFGRKGRIVLYSFGGLAIGSSDLPRRWQRIIVSLAGPAIQLVLWAMLIWLVVPRLPSPFEEMSEGQLWLRRIVVELLDINLYWALLNLLPVWPLDGGRVSRDLFEWFSPRRGFSFALWLSILVGGGLAIYSLRQQDYYLALMFGMLALSSFQLVQQLRAAGPRERPQTWQNTEPWERDPDYWKR